MTREARYSNPLPRRPGATALVSLAMVLLALTRCGSSPDRAASAFGARVLAHWSSLAHVQRVLDLTAARRD